MTSKYNNHPLNMSVTIDSEGNDAGGSTWVAFEVDSLAEQMPGECCICGEELYDGYMCLDGGDEVCHEHVVIKE